MKEKKNKRFPVLKTVDWETNILRYCLTKENYAIQLVVMYKLCTISQMKH